MTAPRRDRTWLWFVALYAGGVIALAMIAAAFRLVVPG